MKQQLAAFLLLLITSFNFSTQAGDKLKSMESDGQFFTDKSYSELKSTVKRADLKKFKAPELKKLAQDLLRNKYDKNYRVASYPAYASTETLAQNLKLGQGFSQYEGVTGVYLEEGEAILFVENEGGKEISLLIPFWMRKPAEGVEPTKDPNGWGLHKQEIQLKEGVNIVNLERAGNAYIKYFDNNPDTAPDVKVHFLSGKINGYFDSRTDSNKDWNNLLKNAISPIMDARGEHIQVAYPVEWFKKFTDNKGKELIDSYDKMLELQYSLMGLVKYNKVPKNRILARVNFNYYMFRDRDGVAYLGNEGTMRMVASPEVVVTGDPCWGFSHEVGHVLQMPQITWGGMTEVSNNIYSMYTAAELGNESRLKNQDNYEKARKSIVESDPKISFLQDPDVFNRLVPFWQLHLYFSQQGHKDFYADLMEELRNRPNAGFRNNSINNMFEFVKVACYIGNTDLTDFFEKWGFFYTGTIELEDYAKYKFEITEQTVKDVKAYIASKNYPKPAIDITTISE